MVLTGIFSRATKTNGERDVFLLKMANGSIMWRGCNKKTRVDLLDNIHASTINEMSY